jgi:hypothetical protein
MAAWRYSLLPNNVMVKSRMPRSAANYPPRAVTLAPNCRMAALAFIIG